MQPQSGQFLYFSACLQVFFKATLRSQTHVTQFRRTKSVRIKARAAVEKFDISSGSVLNNPCNRSLKNPWITRVFYRADNSLVIFVVCAFVIERGQFFFAQHPHHQHMNLSRIGAQHFHFKLVNDDFIATAWHARQA